MNVNVASSESLEDESSKKSFYIGKKILPDHLFYPIFMTTDRIRLFLSDQNERIFVQIDYGIKRLETAKELLSQDKKTLALTTLSKGHRYLVDATEEYLLENKNQIVLDYLKQALLRQKNEFLQIKDQFTDNQRVTIDKILIENQIYQDKLDSTLILQQI